VFAGRRQVGRMTSSTWSPVLKQMIGLATIDARFAGIDSRVEVEHTVDVVRHRVGATVTQTPFLDLKRKVGPTGSPGASGSTGSTGSRNDASPGHLA
jgi:aminomethyltransferase